MGSRKEEIPDVHTERLKMQEQLRTPSVRWYRNPFTRDHWSHDILLADFPNMEREDIIHAGLAALQPFGDAEIQPSARQDAAVRFTLNGTDFARLTKHGNDTMRALIHQAFFSESMQWETKDGRWYEAKNNAGIDFGARRSEEDVKRLVHEVFAQEGLANDFAVTARGTAPGRFDVRVLLNVKAFERMERIPARDEKRVVLFADACQKKPGGPQR